jgi:hypothetical protein
MSFIPIFSKIRHVLGHKLIPAPISESSGAASYKSIMKFCSLSNALRATAKVSPTIPAPLKKSQSKFSNTSKELTLLLYVCDLVLTYDEKVIAVYLTSERLKARKPTKKENLQSHEENE